MTGSRRDSGRYSRTVPGSLSSEAPRSGTGRASAPGTGQVVNSTFVSTSSNSTAATPLSYGINNLVHRFNLDGMGDSHRILAVEYSKSIAFVAGPTPGDVWSTEVRPRHRQNVLNVLYYDSRVETRTPFDIDPTVPLLQSGLWLPLIDGGD